MENFKKLSTLEKTGFIGIILCLAGILVLSGLALFTDISFSPAWLTALGSLQLLCLAIVNWKNFRVLAKVNLGVGVFCLICAIVVAIAE